MAPTLRKLVRRFELPTNARPGSAEDEMVAKLWLALTVMVPAWMIVLILGDWFIFVRKFVPTVLILAHLSAAMAAFYLARRGHARIGAWMLLAAGWIVVTTATWLAGGVVSIIPIFYVVLTAAAGWLLGRRAAALHAVVSCAVLGAMVALDTFGPGLPRFFDVPQLAALLTFGIAMALFTVPLLQIVESVNRKQERLRESESQARAQAAQLQASMDAVPAVILVAHDAECRYITGNQAAYALLRQKPGTNLSKTALNGERPTNYRLMRDGVEIPCQETPLRRVASTGEPIRNYEIALTFDDGISIDLLVNVEPLLDGAGRPQGAVAVLNDITLRKQAERTLAASEEKYRALVETTDIGYVILDSEGRVIDANQEYVRLTGHRELREILGRSVFEWTAAHEKQKNAEALARCLEGGFVRNLLIEYRDGHGGVTPVEINAKVVGDGGPTRILSLCRDITERRRGEVALRQSEERFRSLFENATVGIYRTTPEGRILASNPALVRLLGYSSFEELAYRNLEQEGFEPGYPRSVFRMLLDAQGVATGIEATWTRQDGSAVFVRESARAVRADDGTVLYYDGIVEDFTERKRAEDALRESEERFRNIADTCPVIIWYGDTNRQITFLNKQAGTFSGRNVEELLGTAWAEHVHPDDLASLDSTLASAVSGRHNFQTEFRLRRYDGEYRWMLDTGVPRFVGGVYIGHIGIVHDITELKQNQQQVREHLEKLVNERTRQLKAANAQLLGEIAERKQTEEALRESRAKLAAALASMTDAVFISDAQGHLIDFNDACVTFCRFRTKEECAQTFAGYPDILDMFLADDAPAPKEMWPAWRALGGETIANAEYTLRRKDAFESWIGSFSFGPIRGKDGEILGSVVVGRDITGQKRAEERQRHAQKLESIGILAGGIAHDFNNLLTSILGNASLLQLDAAEESHERLKAILDSSESAAALTRQLLAYAGKGQFQITDFDVSQLVRSSADLIRVSIPKNIDVELDIPPDLPLVRGDSSQIQQVVMNLVINAAEAIGGRDEGRVSISAGVQDFDDAAVDRVGVDIAAGRYISVTVRDNGCGMDAPTKAKVFDPFFTTKFTGRGLGLAAVQGILRTHKGAITVESTPGQGSTFTVYLPSGELRAAASGWQGARNANGQVATVLVVDDEGPVSEFTRAALEALGHRVLLAENGRQALDLLSSNSGVDLVVLDLIMPVVGGVDAFSEMRKRWPELAILVASGYSRYEAQHLGMPAGVPFLEKPYTIQMLADAVDQTLQSRYDG